MLVTASCGVQTCVASFVTFFGSGLGLRVCVCGGGVTVLVQRFVGWGQGIFFPFFRLGLRAQFCVTFGLESWFFSLRFWCASV